MDKVAVGQFYGGAAFVDGVFGSLSEVPISLFDWGFTRSDATYDAASVWQGTFFRLDAHFDRFFGSLEKLRMKISYDRAQVREILQNCVQGTSRMRTSRRIQTPVASGSTAEQENLQAK